MADQRTASVAEHVRYNVAISAPDMGAMVRERQDGFPFFKRIAAFEQVRGDAFVSEMKAAGAAAVLRFVKIKAQG